MKSPLFTEPLRLEPVLVPKPWGGRRLADFGYELPPGDRIGEAWLVADLPSAEASSVREPVTRVASGRYAGKRLQDLIALDRGSFMGEAADLDGRFPLLVKLLDARENLSVQLHPHEAYAAEHPTAAVKVETWAVMEATPGSELMLGLADGVTNEDLTQALGTPDIVALLRRVPARVGDIHHLPAGTVHALGAGVVVAEVQTPSDTTFRLYDWTEEFDRSPREIHSAAAAMCLHGLGEVEVCPPRVAARGGVVDAGHYVVRSHQLGDGDALPLNAAVCRVVLVTSGAVTLPEVGDLRRGEALLLPASWTGVVRSSSQDTALLEAFPPPQPG